MKDTRSREERKEWALAQRRERIVGKTAALLSRKEFSQITLDEVARACGYTVQNLYAYFRDKDDLFAAVLLRALNTIYSSSVKAFKSSDRGIDKVVSMGEQLFAFYLKNSKYFDLNIHFERKYYALHKPPTRKHHGDFIVQCQKVIDQMSDITIEAIRIGIEDGSIKVDADPKHLMLLHWGEALGIIQVALMRRKYFKDVYELTMDTFLAHFRSSVVTYLTQGAK